jgi:hypothetical protein
MNQHAEMTAAAEAAARVVDGADRAKFGAPTPCTEWDTRELLNHLILWTSHSLERRAHGESVEANAELFREYKGFADPAPVPADASPLDRALALSGRDPRWTAPK